MAFLIYCLKVGNIMMDIYFAKGRAWKQEMGDGYDNGLFFFLL